MIPRTPIGTITVWAETGRTAADLSPDDAIKHHRAGDLLPADYLLLSDDAARALLRDGLDAQTFSLFSADARAAVTEAIRAEVESHRRARPFAREVVA